MKMGRWKWIEIELNCSKLASEWDARELNLIFELLTMTNNPVYIKIGKDYDHGKLCFIDIGVIRDLLRQVVKNPREKPYRVFTWATRNEVQISTDLLYQVNMHIVKTGFKRLVGIK